MVHGPGDGQGRAKLVRTAEWEETVGYEDIPHQAQRVAWAGLGGVLILLAGILGLMHIFLTVDLAVDVDMLDKDSTVCVSVWTIFAILAIMGGMLGLMRIRLPLVIIGGIAGIFALGCFLGSILSIVGLIFILLARKDFRAP